MQETLPEGLMRVGLPHPWRGLPSGRQVPRDNGSLLPAITVRTPACLHRSLLPAQLHEPCQGRPWPSTLQGLLPAPPRLSPALHSLPIRGSSLLHWWHSAMAMGVHMEKRDVAHGLGREGSEPSTSAAPGLPIVRERIPGRGDGMCKGPGTSGVLPLRTSAQQQYPQPCQGLGFLW